MTGGGTVGKALDVLDRVAGFGRPVRFSEVLAQSDFPKPTLYRLLQTLTNQDMLVYDPDRQTYSPGIRLLRLAHAAWEQSTLALIARPHIDALSAAVGETVHLAQLDHAQVIYIDKRNANNPVQMFSQAGKVGPAYCTGVGKVMLAFADPARIDAVIAQQSFHRFTSTTLTDSRSLRAELTAIRARGYGFDREEHEPGIICIAMPIRTDTGRVLGAISVTSTTGRTDLAGLESYVPILSDTAAAIAKDARNWSFPEHIGAPMGS
ncbi:IclR family transcriptional regulator [Yoonia sp.]|uniref:IclR family transcriptional regulator n=1 Tax=Yoonia sp. TaxID=2212373 RepID=UPI00391A9CB5